MPFGVPVDPEVKLIYNGSVSVCVSSLSASFSSSGGAAKSSSLVRMRLRVKISAACRFNSSVVIMTAGERTSYICPRRISGSSGFNEQ